MNLLSLWDSVWIALLSSAILFGAYRAIEWRWPERYLGMSQTFGLSSQETWLRFVLYRALPTYVLAATCLVTVERLGGYIWVSGVVMWLVSIGATHGRVVIEGLARRWGEANYAGYHLAMIGMLTIIILFAGVSRNAWGALVSPPDELLSALWSGLLVAGLGGFVVFAVRARPDGAPAYGPAYLVDRATRDVGIGALDWLFQECRRTGADPVLLKSLLVVEAAQRPKWLRSIEHIGVALGLARTSGVMQMRAAKPLSDRESITAAAEKHAGKWAIVREGDSPSMYWAFDTGRSWSTVTTHNPDARFAASVSRVADFLISGGPQYFSFGDDHRTLVLELRRYPKRFALRGVTATDGLALVEISDLTESNVSLYESPPIRANDGWWTFELEIDPSADHVLLFDIPSGRALKIRLSQGAITSITPVRTGRTQKPSKERSPQKPRLKVRYRGLARAAHALRRGR